MCTAFQKSITHQFKILDLKLTEDQEESEKGLIKVKEEIKVNDRRHMGNHKEK